MNPFNYFIHVFKNYANFDGRARRSEYWYFALFNMIFAFCLSFLSPTLYLIYALATLIPGIAVAIRRMHDVGKSGWFILIPIYNLILALTAGESGPNGYGPDPKSDVMEEDVNAIGQN